MYILKGKALNTGVKLKSYGLRNFFKVLTLAEKRELVKSAQKLLKVQMSDNDLIADTHRIRGI